MAEGAGAGYNIPISVSRAETTSLNPNQIAGTVIDFGSIGGASGGWYDQANEPYQPATAVSSAAQRDSAVGPTSVGDKPNAPAISSTTLYIIAGLGIVVTIATAIYLAKRKP